MFSSAVFIRGVQPVYSNKYVGDFATRLEAKLWCHANHENLDDVYVILNESFVEEAGVVDGMFEEDKDYIRSIT